MIHSKCLRLFFVAETVALLAVIFLFSAQDAESSGRISGAIARFIFIRLPKGLTSYRALHHLIRKAGHFTEFALLGQAVSCLIASLTRRGFPWLPGASTFALTVLSAALDEFHQGSVRGRVPALGDVAIDSAGALCGIILSLSLIALFFLFVRHQKGHFAA